MDSNLKNTDLLRALEGTTKSALSLVPVLGQIIAGYDAYKKSQFDRNVDSLLSHLQNKVEDISTVFSAEWLQTEEGQQFSCKVVESALDGQLLDKQELFANCLINGVKKTETPYLEKLKFVDMVRGLSRVSLLVLAEMDKMFIDQVRGPNRSTDPVVALAVVNSEDIAKKLSNKFNPYIVSAAVSELESHGLFSRTGEWIKGSNGEYVTGGGFATELCYTDFSAKFVEFVAGIVRK